MIASYFNACVLDFAQQVAEVKNVYDVVDEDTYVETVNDRLKNDWIVDDGTGMV